MKHGRRGTGAVLLRIHVNTAAGLLLLCGGAKREPMSRRIFAEGTRQGDEVVCAWLREAGTSPRCLLVD